MDSQSSSDQNDLSSPTVIGILVLIAICAFLIGFLTSRFSDWIRPTLKRSLANTTTSSPVSSTIISISPTEGNDLDLEAALNQSSPVPPKLKNNPSHRFPAKKNATVGNIDAILTSFGGSFSIKKKTRPPQGITENKRRISRPTRLLPANSSFVIVKSPLASSENDSSQLQTCSSTSYPTQPLNNQHPRLSLSYETTTTKGSRYISSRKSGGVDEFGRKINQVVGNQEGVGTSSTQTSRKRTIIWYDDDILKTRSIQGSIRSIRSHSLPSSSTTCPSSSVTSSASNNQSGQRISPSDCEDTNTNLGSSTELWLSYQFHLAGT